MNNKYYNYYTNDNYNRTNFNEFLNPFDYVQQDNNLSMNNTNIKNNIFGPYDGYLKGNLFKNIYDEYKNFKPEKLIPKSEQEEALLNLNQIHFAMHDANLYLDVYPNDKHMMNEYIKFRDAYNKLLNDYQIKYGAMNVNSNNLNNTPFGWEEEPFPWDRRRL